MMPSVLQDVSEHPLFLPDFPWGTVSLSTLELRFNEGRRLLGSRGRCRRRFGEGRRLLGSRGRCRHQSVPLTHFPASHTALHTKAIS